MPKYVLDEKGILTITSEHDGGIFTVNDVLKKNDDNIACYLYCILYWNLRILL